MNAALTPAEAAPQPAKPAMNGKNRWMLLGLIPAALAVLFLVPMTLILIGGGLYWNAARAADNVSLENASGWVSVARTGDPDSWRTVESETLSSGWMVRTGADSAATLVFHEGTQIDLGPDTEVSLDQVDGGWGGALEVSISQKSGITVHRVVPLQGESSAYVVQTPGGATEVHGTTFSVEVGAGGDSRVLVDSGQVTVAAAGEEVVLLAGQATSASPGHSPEPPAYQFYGEGELLGIIGTTWSIGGVSMTVIDQTKIVGEPAPGNFVAVRGRILDGGLWLADEIKRLDRVGIPSFSFSGRLESVEGSSWTVGGQAIQVDQATVIEGAPQPGDVVKVTFGVQADGVWLAMKISGTLEDGDDPTPTPGPTPDPDAQPSLSFVPDELELANCTDNAVLSASLANTADGEDDVAANVELDYILIENPDFVSAVSIVPASWEAIQAAEVVNFDVTVELNPAWTAAPPGIQVVLRVFVASETNLPEGHRTRLTLTITSDCDRGPTPTPTVTPTGTLTPSVTPTIVATPSPPGPTDCTGADPHPHGMTLAERYGVPYEEIMGWFCQGFGFGEIEHAYTLSQETGIPVSEIFAMRQSGMGWGQIFKELTDKGKPKKDK
jgi:hypothetical protein